MKGGFWGILAAVIAVGWIANTIGHHGSKSSDSTAASSGSASIGIVHGSDSDNSCSESDGEARLYVTITVRNTGTASGE